MLVRFIVECWKLPSFFHAFFVPSVEHVKVSVIAASNHQLVNVPYFVDDSLNISVKQVQDEITDIVSDSGRKLKSTRCNDGLK
jgi:hypothetical protein